MDRARTVLNLINLFDSTDREIIMENINYGMPDLAGWRMEQYRRIFAYTGKSKSFVLSWFNHGVKLPLVDLCKISNLMGINVYSMLKKNGSYEALKQQSQQDNLVFGEDVATIYIEVFNAHRSADKSVVVDKLEECYGKSTDYHSGRMERVTGITGATKVAYRSWFARSRTRVRLPLDAMCKLAIEANVDIMEFFVKPEEENGVLEN